MSMLMVIGHMLKTDNNLNKFMKIFNIINLKIIKYQLSHLLKNIIDG